MSDLIILTDSSADLGEDMARELDVRVIPLGFVLDEHTYRDYPDSREMDPHTTACAGETPPPPAPSTWPSIPRPWSPCSGRGTTC